MVLIDLEGRCALVIGEHFVGSALALLFPQELISFFISKRRGKMHHGLLFGGVVYEFVWVPLSNPHTSALSARHLGTTSPSQEKHSPFSEG
jgi:hypothetical protein